MKYFALFCCLLAAGCSKNEPKLLQQAREAEMQKQYQAAADKYEEIASGNSTSAFAETSLTVLPALYTNDLHQYDKAAGAYRRYAVRFPQSGRAPSMLFLAGFIFNNELHQFDSAKSVYDEFLAKYPNDSLAESARFELRFLGKDPGSIIEPQAAAPEVDRKSVV